ncbi:MAG: F0F1 ATP synthase subunit A [Planctomycetota bacterium]|jgi:F-type H+-transporting ATPase subunit a|nr:F0F1 ATP synthase subunit A [Planctomycetota bacterium]
MKAGTRARAAAPIAVILFFHVLCGESAWAGLDNPPPLEFLGIQFNHATVIHSALAAVAVYLLVCLLTINLSRERPRRGQVVIEMLVDMLLGLVKQTIGPTRGPKFLPFIGTLFLFVWAGNMLSLFPVESHHFGGEFFHDYNRNGLYDPGEPFIDMNGDGVHNPGFQLPRLEEPTTDLTFPVTLAVIFVVVLGHGSGIRFRGLFEYLKEYFSPGGIMGIGMFPLNVVGKLSELVSISFRIFGNIFGGAIIMSVVSGLVFSFLLPIGMYGYFSVFCGTIQAFVFTMLAATYISMEAAEEAENKGDADQ